DTIAPETGDDAKAAYFSSATITLTASDAGSGVDYIAYRLDGAATQTVDAVSTAVSTAVVGNHNLSYWAADNAGNASDKTLVRFAVLAPAQNHTPVRAQNRYGMAVAIAKEAFPGWVGVKHVVIASGEDRAAADPLAAAGLCGVYDAPLLLLRGASVPGEVADAIRAMPDGLVIHVVGGPNSVPKSLLTQLRASPGVKSVERLPYGDRYQTAAEVAKRMKSVLVAEGGSLPTTALIANGADPNKFADALALSPISTSEHYPVLLVKADSIPGPTQAALTSLGLTTRIIGGGPATVKDSVKKTLGAERWSGDDRYATARTIATKAIGRGWLEPRCTGIAAKLADALTGGSLVGRMNGVLLLTRSESLSAPTAEFLRANKAVIEDCYVFGGTASVYAKTRLQIDAALK
ncbi:MAG: cell wall-binding repeat-containing protein, partial [Coriobacteriia bacterium]|nr:cell wall-binding repeat-containing protein [Coriobacteriia bacterium]